ncbi:MAG: hypothetical protein LW688_09790 [Cryomorphaceae bacterium]|nr:hypothetical protein [Cryomorphaceae bacterium]
MKSTKDNLHALIHSLNPTEKRFFKRFVKSRKAQENDYLNLFNEMNSMRNYDKGVLMEKIADYNFREHLEVKKHYLFQLILDSQRQYRDAGLTMHNKLTEIDILIQNILEYKLLFLDLSEIVSQNSFVRNSRQMQRLERFKTNRYLKDPTAAKSFTAQMHFYLCNYLFKATIGDNTSCYNAAVKMHRLIKSHPEALKGYDKLYLRAVSARLSALTLLGYRKKEFQTLISELKTNTLRMKDRESRKIAQAIFYEFQLIFHVRQKNFEKALELAQTATIFVRQNAILSDGNAIKYLSFDIAKTHFVIGNYAEANKWFLKQSYSESKTKSSDIFAFSRILSLFCDVFLNETENIRYNASYLRNYLSKHGHLFEYESFLLSRIIKYFVNWNSSTAKGKKLVLQNFKQELGKQLDSPWKANMILYFDFEWWVELLVEQLKSES